MQAAATGNMHHHAQHEVHGDGELEEDDGLEEEDELEEDKLEDLDACLREHRQRRYGEAQSRSSGERSAQSPSLVFSKQAARQRRFPADRRGASHERGRGAGWTGGHGLGRGKQAGGDITADQHLHKLRQQTRRGRNGDDGWLSSLIPAVIAVGLLFAMREAARLAMGMEPTFSFPLWGGGGYDDGFDDGYGYDNGYDDGYY